MERTIFDDEHELFRGSVRQFLDAGGRSTATTSSSGPASSTATSSVAAGAAGFLGFAVPEEHGGGGARDFRYNAVLGEETAALGLASVGLGLTLHTDICQPYFLDLTTDEQKARWLPGHRLGRAHHRRGHDRAGRRLRPRDHRHHRRCATATTTSSTARRPSSPTASTPTS